VPAPGTSYMPMRTGFVRDAVLHDLVASPWPVGYGTFDGQDTVLRAPVAFYMPAALVGKWGGLHAADAAMGLWTALGASLFLLQVLSLIPPRGKSVIIAVAVVIRSAASTYSVISQHRASIHSALEYC